RYTAHLIVDQKNAKITIFTGNSRKKTSYQNKTFTLNESASHFSLSQVTDIIATSFNQKPGYYIAMSKTEFSRCINNLGGLSLKFVTSMTINHKRYTKGTHRLNGAEVLSYLKASKNPDKQFGILLSELIKQKSSFSSIKILNKSYSDTIGKITNMNKNILLQLLFTGAMTKFSIFVK
ncbi:MAG: LCP family protein, partial [Bacilli bacterium]